jgi:hypothetical protein
MKKVLTALAGSAVVAGGIFYFASGELVANEVNTQLTTLQTHGFVIEERKQDSTGEHFIISLADMHKFAKLIPEYEAVLLAKDKSALKEFKLGIDLSSSGSEVSLDLYPVSFPTAELSIQEKEMIDRYIAEKTLTLHLNYNTLSNNFDGSLKDIDEQIKNAIGVKLIGLAFDGNFNDDKIALNYELNEFKIADDKKSIVELSGVSSEGTYEGLNYYISNGTTNIDKVLVNIPDTLDSVAFSDTKLIITSDVKNDLFESRLSMVAKTVDATIKNDNYILDTFTFDYGLKNINIEAFDKLVTALDKENPNFKSPKVEKNIEDLLASGMVFDIYKFGIENIIHNGETLKGFSLQTNFELGNNLDIQTVETSPMQALSSITMNSKIEISDEIFSKAIQDPRAMMVMMVQPKEVNGYKIYDIELKDSKVEVNGLPMM